MIIYSNDKQLIIDNCKNLTTNLHIAAKNAKKIQHIIIVKFKIIILFHTIEQISIHKIRKELSNRDYFFELKLLNAYAHVANVNVFAIYIQNDATKSRVIFTRVKLNYLIEFEK